MLKARKKGAGCLVVMIPLKPLVSYAEVIDTCQRTMPCRTSVSTSGKWVWEETLGKTLVRKAAWARNLLSKRKTQAGLREAGHEMMQQGGPGKASLLGTGWRGTLVSTNPTSALPAEGKGGPVIKDALRSRSWGVARKREGTGQEIQREEVRFLPSTRAPLFHCPGGPRHPTQDCPVC